MGTKIHNSSRKISLGSYTTDNIPRVRDRLCKNENILSNYQATIRVLAQTIGVIMSLFRAVLYDQMYYKELEKCKVQSLARYGGNFHRKAYISEEAAYELKCG